MLPYFIFNRAGGSAMSACTNKAEHAKDISPRETARMNAASDAMEEKGKEVLAFSNEARGIDGDLSIEKEMKSDHSSNNKDGETATAENNNLRFHPNNPCKHRETDELTLNIEDNTEQKLNQAMTEVTQKQCPVESDCIVQIQEACKDEDKATERSCSNDKTVIAIDESTLVKFRNNFFEAIEELRIQRTLDEENEERIKCLMTEKHELERKKEEEFSKSKALVEQHAQQEIDIKKQQEDRLLQFEEEKAKQTMTAECSEKELKVLKDEVRALHLVKYNLEKKIKEQERLIQLQNSARDSHESQMSALEQRSKKAFDQCTLLADLVDKTELNHKKLFAAASRLHRKLIYTNEHQKCLLESYKRELESKKVELVALKATMAQKKDSLMSNTAEEVNRANALERELRMKNDACRQSQSQLDASRKENVKLMESLKEAHKLLDRHIQSINKHSELEAVAHLELDEIKTEYQSLKETLKKEKEEKQCMEDTLTSNKAEWEKQKKALQRRLEDLQKEHDSLSEAHNSLEQLNSDWSERNMEQKTRIESASKEMDELRMRLTQVEESFQSQKEMNKELKRSCEIETQSLSEKLLQAKQDFKGQTERADSLENESTVLREKVEDLEQKILKKEKEQALKCKETTDASSQTANNVSEISSLSDQLLKAKQSCTKETERADYLETQCSLLDGKIRNLMQEIAEKEKDQSETKGKNATAVQTDHILKINQFGESQKGSCFRHMEVNEDLNISESAMKESGHIHHQDEKGLTITDTYFKKDVTQSAVPVLIAIENVNQEKQRELIRENDHPEPQLKVVADNNDDKEKTSNSKCGVLDDTITSDGLVSTNTVTVTTVRADAANKATPPTNYVSVESDEEDQCTNEKESDIRSDLREVEIEIGNKEIEVPSKISQELVKDDVADDGDHSEESVTSGNKESIQKIQNSDTHKMNILNKENPVAKKVRFNLEGTKTSSFDDARKQPAYSKREVRKQNSQMMFSDEEDGESECGKIDERISRIQNLLRSDRLRTNRKRKHPVV